MVKRPDGRLNIILYKIKSKFMQCVNYFRYLYYKKILLNPNLPYILLFFYALYLCILVFFTVAKVNPELLNIFINNYSQELTSTDLYNVNMSLPGGNGNPSLPTGGGDMNGMPSPGNGPSGYNPMSIGSIIEDPSIDSQERQQPGQGNSSNVPSRDERQEPGQGTSSNVPSRDHRMSLEFITGDQNINSEQPDQGTSGNNHMGTESITGDYVPEEIRDPGAKAERKYGHVFRFYDYSQGRYIEPEAYHGCRPTYNWGDHIRTYRDGDLIYQYHCYDKYNESRFCNIIYPNGWTIEGLDHRSTMSYINTFHRDVWLRERGVFTNDHVAYFKECFERYRSV